MQFSKQESDFYISDQGLFFKQDGEVHSNSYWNQEDAQTRKADQHLLFLYTNMWYCQAATQCDRKTFSLRIRRQFLSNNFQPQLMLFTTELMQPSAFDLVSNEIVLKIHAAYYQ